MIVAGSLRGSTLSKPIMDLVFECQVYRAVSKYTGIGSLVENSYVMRNGITPCDVLPLTDDLIMAESGQADIITHSVHLPAGTDVAVRDAVKILTSRTGFGPIGLSFYVEAVLLPSESISYVRCHCKQGKEPVTEPLIGKRSFAAGAHVAAQLQAMFDLSAVVV